MRDDTSEHLAFALPGARPHYGPDKTRRGRAYRPSLDASTSERSIARRRLHDHGARARRAGGASHARRRRSRDRGRRTRATSRPANGKLELGFEPAIAPGERKTFSVTYRVSKPRHGLFFIKPTAAHPEKVAHAWTQSQDEYARYWFPCLDYPHEKQRYVDDHRRAEGHVRAGQRRSLSNGRTRAGTPSFAIARTCRTART